jgi:hypothetical protein
MAGDGQIEHLDPLFCRREVALLLMGWKRRGQEMDLVQPALLAAALGQEQVSVVYGIETPPKQSQAHGVGLAGLSAIQFEARNPKLEIRMKSEAPNPNVRDRRLGVTVRWLFWISVFGHSGLFRISDFLSERPETPR